MVKEKVRIALVSIAAAIFLTTLKLIVGIATRSLGIISEAVHSALDLFSTLVTLFAVRISDKPADKSHHYGHGKVENLSALVQTLLLLITCIWIIYEAVHRLIYGNTNVEVNVFSFLVIIISIIVDVARSRVLLKAAKKYNSQVFEADAYHFSTDILSSGVVILGLVFVQFGVTVADSIAALIVSAIVIMISARLGKSTIAVLLDTAPKGMAEKIEEVVRKAEGVVECSNIRVRPSGSSFFVDVEAGIDKHFSHKEIQDTVKEIRARIQEQVPNSDTMVSTYPANRIEYSSENAILFNEIRAIIKSLDICINLHHIKVFNVKDARRIALHVEVDEELGLEKTHELSHLLESKIKAVIPGIYEIDVLVETAAQEEIDVDDITEASKDIVREIEKLLNKVPDRLNCHDVKIYKQKDKIVTFLHCGLYGDFSNQKIQKITRRIVGKIKTNIKNVEDVYIHVEPIVEK